MDATRPSQRTCAERVVLHRVAQLGHAVAGRRWNGDVVHAPVLVALDRRRDPRAASSSSKSPVERAARAPRRAARGSTVARKPIAPKLNANTGTPRPGVGAQRGQDAAVAAEHHRQVGGLAGVRAQQHALLLLDAVLLDLVRRHQHLDPPRRARASSRRPTQSPRLLGVLVREERDRASACFTAPPRRAAASSRSTAPVAPGLGQPHEASRGCPPGPGRPRGRVAEHRRARSAPPTRPPRRARRGGRRPSAPRRPCPPARGPTSNCGLTSARQSQRAAAAASRRGSTFVSEMNERSATTRSGRYGSSSGSSSRALRRSITVTRGSLRSRQCELAVGDVERDHVLGAALEQAVGEPARGGARRRGSAARRGRARTRRARSRASGRRARRSAAPPRARPRTSSATICPGFSRGPPLVAEPHVAREHRSRRTGAGLEQAALRQQRRRAACVTWRGAYPRRTQAAPP